MISYKVTFELITEQQYDDDIVTLKTRTYPRFLAGVHMTRQMFIELMLAENPISSVGIVRIEEIK